MKITEIIILSLFLLWVGFVCWNITLPGHYLNGNTLIVKSSEQTKGGAIKYTVKDIANIPCTFVSKSQYKLGDTLSIQERTK
jgi:hypothetical protein